MVATSLERANDILRDVRGITTELDYERQKASGLASGLGTASGSCQSGGTLSAEEIESVSEAVRSRGANYVTIRRLVELFRSKSISPNLMREVLVVHDPSRVNPPLWDVRQLPS